ncbi:ceramide synthase 2 [Neolamprologus brichardi]|uniref:ceramide synthase 2 n=1 Tax=Neolamprologus brichardi TaxID=32507 RepID=UPI0003EC1D48|nr:ceramide synthase 2 [Neolamprologus brichardi]
MFDTLHECFWSESLWLPVGLTWADLEDKEGRVYAKASHLYVTLPYALAFLLIRYLFERWIATPLAVSAGIKQRVYLKAEENSILEFYYTTRCRNPAQVDIDGLSKKSSLSTRQVERWFRRRRRQDRPGVLKKFTEASWRFVFYLYAFIGGMVALHDKEWLYDTREVWTGFPKQTMLESQYWYYILEMSFYGCLLFSVAFDVKRKSAKLFNYAKWEKTCKTLFVLFAIMFMVTRLIIFPFWLIHCTWVYPVLYYPAFFGYYFFNTMLVVLLCLHIFWAYLILRMIRKFMFGTLTKDERSDNDEEDGDESSSTQDEVEQRHKPGGSLVADKKYDKNRGSRSLSPPENICWSKTVC